jgi:hypothetical protein
MGQVNAARMAAGWRKVTLFLDPEALAGLDALKRAHGSKDAGARALLASYAPHPQQALSEIPPGG